MATPKNITRFVINPTYPCSCTIDINGTDDCRELSIAYCSMHAEAPKLMVNVQHARYRDIAPDVLQRRAKSILDRIFNGRG